MPCAACASCHTQSTRRADTLCVCAVAAVRAGDDTVWDNYAKQAKEKEARDALLKAEKEKERLAAVRTCRRSHLRAGASVLLACLRVHLLF